MADQDSRACQVTREATNIIVVTGAGISTAAGVPDFRSASGLYRLKTRGTGAFRGEDVFQFDILKQDTRHVFCKFMYTMRQQILRRPASESATHTYLRKLYDQGRLVRCFTQNIDGLERDAGLPVIDFDSYTTDAQSAQASLDPALRGHVVQLHGDIHTLRCSVCRGRRPWDQADDDIFRSGQPPTCTTCEERARLRALQQKRMRGQGYMRPDIVLYQQPHPDETAVVQFSSHHSLGSCDLLLVLGTEARVPGLRNLVRSLADHVHSQGGSSVMVNKTSVSNNTLNSLGIDFFLQMTCEQWLTHVDPPEQLHLEPAAPDQSKASEHELAIYPPAKHDEASTSLVRTTQEDESHTSRMIRNLAVRRQMRAARDRWLVKSMAPPGTFSWQGRPLHKLWS